MANRLKTTRATANKRFAKSGNNYFDLRIYVKFVVLASGENFALKCRLRQAADRLVAMLTDDNSKHLMTKK